MMTKRKFITSALVGVIVASAATVGAYDIYQRGELGDLTELIKLQAPPIRSVRVGGQLDHVSRRELELAIAPHLGDGFFGANVQRIADAARTLPWVASISVRRVWPDSLHIAVIERQAVARWGADGLVAATGEVFTPKRTGPVDHLPLLSGPDGTSQRLLIALREATERLDGVGGGIAELSLSEHGIWRIQSARGIEIVFRDQQFAALSELARLYEPLLGRSTGRVAGIDLRYTNGFSVRWKPPEPVAPSRERA